MKTTVLAVVISFLLTATCFAFGKGHQANGTYDHMLPTDPEWRLVYEGDHGHNFYVEMSSLEFNWRKRQFDFYMKEVVKGNEKKAEIYDCIWNDQHEYLIMVLQWKGPQVEERYKVKRKFKDYEGWGKIHARHKAIIYRLQEILAEEPDRVHQYQDDERYDYSWFRDPNYYKNRTDPNEYWEDSQW